MSSSLDNDSVPFPFDPEVINFLNECKGPGDELAYVEADPEESVNDAGPSSPPKKPKKRIASFVHCDHLSKMSRASKELEEYPISNFTPDLVNLTSEAFKPGQQISSDGLDSLLKDFPSKRLL